MCLLIPEACTQSFRKHGAGDAAVPREPGASVVSPHSHYGPLRPRANRSGRTS